MNKITIAVDAMGGDHGPSVVVPAALAVVAGDNTSHLILVGDRDVLQKELDAHPHLNKTGITIQHASQKVEMSESPAQALRMKKDSSMRIAINLVKEKVAHACVSAGNTGALMATARFVLKTIPGIDRPAIISTFPTILGKNVRMLDLGADVDSAAENLFQYAVMGSVLATAVDNIKSPKICLLNIGSEDIKGNEQVKETALLLLKAPMLNYVGYIEGDDIYKGEADIIVCDGFVGNVALKTTEGVSLFIRTLLRQAYSRNIFTRLVGLLSLPVLKAAIKRIDADLYNGATLIGLQGIVIKSHGGASQKAFSHAITEAITQAKKNVPDLISAEVERVLKLSKSGE